MKSLLRHVLFIFGLPALFFVSCQKEKEKKLPTGMNTHRSPIAVQPGNNVSKHVFTGLKWQTTTAGLLMITPPLNMGFTDHAPWLNGRVHVELVQQGSSTLFILPYEYYQNKEQTGHTLFYSIKNDIHDFYDWGGPVMLFTKQSAGLDPAKKVDVTIYVSL